MIQVNVRGIKEIVAKYQGISNRFNKEIEFITNKVVGFVVGKIPPYPEEPPNSTYDRTGRLGRSVRELQGSNPDALSRTEVRPFGAVGFIGTRVDYSPFVIDEGNQARVHRGRWWTLQKVVHGLTNQIVKMYHDGLRRLFR